MDEKQGKGIVICGFAGLWRVQIVDFDRGGVPEKISSSFISRKQVDRIAADWHYETGYPIFEKTLTKQQ